MEAGAPGPRPWQADPGARACEPLRGLGKVPDVPQAGLWVLAEPCRSVSVTRVGSPSLCGPDR